MRNLHRTFVAALVAATALAVAACAPVRVNTSLERGMDFTHYKSYAWAPGDKFSTGDPRLDNNEFFENRLKATGEKVLAMHGFEEATPATADLVIHYHANVRETIDVNELDRRYGYCDTCSTTIYNAGTITLDFVDSHTNKLVWRGWSEGSLEGIDSQALIEQRVDDAVTRILAKLPPRM
ncbi:MAG: DUF4136 domain-containing protein [Vicinamibacterales bacterium]